MKHAKHFEASVWKNLPCCALTTLAFTQLAAAELLSFLDQVEVAGRIREIIDTSTALQADNDLRFRWTRLRHQLNEANIYVSLKSLWIRPYVYPLTANDHYRNVQQRLYVSATIGDAGDLSRRLGTRPIEKIPVLPEYAQQTYGRRLIVMNRIEEAVQPYPKPALFALADQGFTTPFQQLVACIISIRTRDEATEPIARPPLTS